MRLERRDRVRPPFGVNHVSASSRDRSRWAGSSLIDPSRTVSIINPHSITAIDNTLVALRERDWFDISALDRGNLTALLADRASAR